MKYRLTILLTVYTCLNIQGQTFSDSYYEFFKRSWEKEPTEEMKAQVDPSLDSIYRQSTGKGFWELQTEEMKQSTLNNIENYKSVFKLKKFDINEKSKLIIIEESARGGDWPPDLTREGIVILENQTFTYRFDPNEEDKYKLVSDFLDSNYIYFDSRKIITDLAKSYKIDSLTVLAKMEMEVEFEVLQPKVEYEIVVYNRSADKPLKIIYLHDFVSKLKEK